MKHADDTTERLKKLESVVQRLEEFTIGGFWHVLDQLYDGVLASRLITCIICGFEAKRDGFKVLVDQCQFGGGKLERYACPKCECIFGPQKYLDLEPRMVDLDYALLYSRYSESDSTHLEERTFQSLTPRREGLYLNWGCGGVWGNSVQLLRGLGWNVWGYEPSIESTSNFVVKYRGEISAKFDGIFSNNVIEHFRDPVAQFKDFHSILKPLGSMAHSSPCYNYSHAYSRFHTVFLLGRSPLVLAERTGFRVVDSVREDDYINYVFEKTS